MITADLLCKIPLFEPVPLAERESIAARAADIHLQPNEWLIQEGEQPGFFFFLEGRLAVTKLVGGQERVINEYGPGDFAGEVPLLLGSPAIASLRALEPCRVGRLEPSDFRELVAGCRNLSARLMSTMATRVERLQKLQTTAPIASVTVIGHRLDIACHALRDFLARNHVTYRFEDLRERGTPDRDARFPLVVLQSGERLVTPTFRELAHALGLATEPGAGTYDVVVIGGGPAGLAAAVYGASEGLRTLLVERHAPGGQAGTSSRIENYLGFPTGVGGDELGTRALAQARRFGVDILVARSVTGMDAGAAGTPHVVRLDGDTPVPTRAIVLANGVEWRQLEVPGAADLVGRGVYYGAARTEAPATRGQDIFLIGGGNSAGQAAMFFANYARTVTLLVRGPALADTMSHYLIEQLRSKDNVRILTRQQVVAVEGDTHLAAIMIEDRTSRARRRELTPALFAFIGADARTDWLPRDLIRDERGYVCTGRDVLDLVARHTGRWPLARDPYLLETNLPGIFAAGDVRHGSIKRVASGVGEGSMAIAFVHQYLAEAQKAAPRAAPATAPA
jgi:thioredoxin reductase (NADPH)